MKTTFYKLQVLREQAESLLPRWREQGWDPTIVKVGDDLCVVTLDLLADENSDPTQHKGIIQTLYVA